MNINIRVVYAEGRFGPEKNYLVFYLRLRVQTEIYSNNVIKACNLWTWEEIERKGRLRFIRLEDGPDPGLREVDVLIRQGQEKQVIPLIVNTAGTTLEQIKLNIMGLRSLKIHKAKWQIVAVTWPSE